MSKREIKAIVCDDHPIFRNGLVTCLSENPNIVIASEASDGQDCISKLEIFKPDLLITDLSMPILDGFQVLKWVSQNQPKLRVFILSVHSELSYVERAEELGANGFIAKEDAVSELLTAIEMGQSNFYMSQSIGAKPRAKPRAKLDVQENKKIIKKLENVSEAEFRVLSLLTESKTSREIAEELFLSIRTVDAHRANLADKLDAKGPNKLLEFAVRYREDIKLIWNSYSADRA